jgi:predicted DNA-binding transcriptional regulator AlpA
MPELTQPVRVLPFPKWCELNGFSTRTGRRLIASGQGPKVIQLSENRIGIREDHNTEWQNSRAR